MKARHSTLLSLPCLAALCASCSQQQVPEFEVRAIDADEEVVPCLILVDDQVLLDGPSNQPIRSPARIALTFPTGSDGRPSNVKLGVRPLAAAAAAEGPAEGDPEAAVPPDDPADVLYAEESRFVAPLDSRTQLFVLRRRKAGTP